MRTLSSRGLRRAISFASVAAILVVIVVAAAVGAYLALSLGGDTSTNRSTSSSSSSSCYYVKAIGLTVQILSNDSAEKTPMQGVVVEAVPAYFCNGTEVRTAVLLQETTDSSGRANFDGFSGGYYIVTIDPQGRRLNFTVPMYANQVSSLTLYLSSGKYEVGATSTGRAVATETVTEQVVVQQNAFGRAYRYGTCTGIIGTVSYSYTTVTTEYFMRMASSQISTLEFEQQLVTLTVTVTSFAPKNAQVNFTTTETWQVTSSPYSVCPTIS